MGCVNSTASKDALRRSELDEETSRRKSERLIEDKNSSFVDPVTGEVHFVGAENIADDKNRKDEDMDRINKKIGQSGPLTSAEYGRRIVSSEGVKNVTVPNATFSMKVAYVSQRGYYPESLNKANQDAFCFHHKLGGTTDVFAGVFDGHGEHGTPCAEFARDKIPELLSKDPSIAKQTKKALFNSFVTANAKLHASSVDDSMSGTTAISAHLRGNHLSICNVGDSRAVAGEEKGGKTVAVDLSHDQTPFRADECARVQKCGARVLTLDQLEGLKDPNVQCWGTEEDDDGDPPRLWVPNGMYPGTAFTRSIGDHVAEKIGVSAEPEILERTLESSTKYIVIASDGVFEFLPSQTVMDMVTSHEDIHDAALEIVLESYRLWLQFETRTDDITIIIMKLDWDNVASPSAAANSLEAPRKSQGAVASGMNRPVRRMLSRAKRAAIESSNVVTDEAPEAYEPPKNIPRKSQEDLDRLNLAVKNNFLFAHLHPEQKSLIFAVMEKMLVKKGDLIIRQGDAGDAFYVINTGQYDVHISSGSDGEGLGPKVHTYTSSKTICPSFGELSLMYGQPRAASVLAATDGELWRLDRRAYKGLLSRADSRQLIRTLRTVDVLASLNFGQLQRLADIMTRKTYGLGEHIIRQGDDGNEFYIIQEGEASCTIRKDPSNAAEKPKEVLKLGPGQYFGERALLSNAKRAANVVASTNIVALMLDRGRFEKYLGELKTIIDTDRRWRERVTTTNEKFLSRPSVAAAVQMSIKDFEQYGSLWSSESGVMATAIKRKGGGDKLVMRTTSIPLVNKRGASKLVLRSREVTKTLPPHSFVPAVIKRFKSDRRLYELIYCQAKGSFQGIFVDEDNNTAPIPEECVRYYAASLVLAIEHIHMAGMAIRSLDPAHIVVAEDGNIQLIDLRFAKTLEHGRTFTLCGSPEYAAPEMLANGGGHDSSADLWMLGVFLYHISYKKTPFADAKDEPTMFKSIIEHIPGAMKELSPKLADLITKLMTTDPLKRIGSGNISELKAHGFFAGVNWEALQDMQVQVPRKALELVTRFKEFDFADFEDEHLPTGDASWTNDF